jgi:RecA-family ATPase
VATGRPLLGDTVHHQGNVVFLSLEDPPDEFDRQLAAACAHHGVAKGEIEGRIKARFGRVRPVVMAALGEGGHVLFPDRDEIIRRVQEAGGAALLEVDPWVNSHEIDESKNPQVAAAMRAWIEVAEACGCAVLLVHHTRKGKQERGQADAARGAGALINAARVAATLYAMDEEEAEEFDLLPEEAKLHVRLDPAKSNLARIMHEGWRAWSKPLSGNRIRMRPLNPAGSGDHARQS